jgi:N-acetylmuramoyl-L-alanine amidase
VTRIVLDSQAIKDFTVFQMGNPSRIVIDVSNDTRVATAQPQRPTATTTPTTPNVTPGPNTTRVPTGTRPTMPTEQTLADALGLQIRTIVIDPGHGGRDPGAVAHGMFEKDIVLEIALHLRDLLRQHNPDLTVHLTRETDVFVPLEERTAIANKHRADLFVSIHVNATRSGQARGVETYVLNVTNDQNALAVAAFENQATTKALSDLHGILRDIMLNSKLEESLLLAGAVQRGMVRQLKLPPTQDLGVKQAPFYVLMGAMMPSILVEAGFLTNREDARLLQSSAHRKEIARGIHAGIVEYINKYNK